MLNQLLPAVSTPDWLADLSTYKMQHEYFPLIDLLRDSLYYPASGFDGTPIKYLAGHFLSFVYVDYGRSHEEFINELEDPGVRGYDLVGCRRVTERELAPHGWQSVPPASDDGEPFRYLDWIQEPFCTWSVFQIHDDTAEWYGPRRFSLLYICADGVAAYQALYVTNSIVPKAVALIQPGYGFGANYTDFEDPEKIFAKSVLELNTGGQPDVLIYGGLGRLEFYREPCWPHYGRHVCIFSMKDANRHISVWKRG